VLILLLGHERVRACSSRRIDEKDVDAFPIDGFIVGFAFWLQRITVTTLRPMHVVRAVLLALFAASQLVSATIHVQCGSAGQHIAALLPQEALHSRPHTLAPQNSDSEASLPTCMKWFTASFVDALIEGVKASGGSSFTVEEERNGALVSVRKVV
jgi:hypothetical protein